MHAPDKLLESLRGNLQALSDPAQAPGMSAYMRNLFPFFGIKKPDRAHLFKEYFRELLAANADPHHVAKWCWEQQQREWQYFGMEYFTKARKFWNPSTPDLIDLLVVNKSWWDTVDYLAVHAAGKYFLTHPGEQDYWIGQWRHSENIWLVRVAVLFQLQYKDKTDTELLFDICRQHAHQSEFFIRKAIGWALRQYARTNPEAVKAFAASTPLSALSRREALKHIGQ